MVKLVVGSAFIITVDFRAHSLQDVINWVLAGPDLGGRHSPGRDRQLPIGVRLHVLGRECGHAHVV